ncbi:hypothetical protein OBBRIDRAFT_793088 [Obba rivulosa]|uniref:Uncharacterized protein n=1 Tax=Obba rivulosa TaxID=1052685 RepID=A0A8E2AYY1_9APHY|nr:hypothetical protein OBBRIDRAFT_793088 [Obba rivulosa]
MLLFHLNRWTTTAWAISQLVVELLPLGTLPSCEGLNFFNGSMDVILMTIWAVFSAIRIYTITAGNWLLASVVFTLSIVPMATNTYGFFASYVFQIVQFPGDIAECTLGRTISPDVILDLTIVTRTCAITADVILLATTWVKTYSSWRSAKRNKISCPLTTMLLKDGTLYFFVLLSLNVISIAGVSTNVFIDTAGSFATPLQAIIVSHFLINLRQVARGPQNGNSEDTGGATSCPANSSLRFISFIDNMGEHLDHGARESTDNSIDWFDDVGEVETTRKLEHLEACTAIKTDHEAAIFGDVRILRAKGSDALVSACTTGYAD